MNASGAVARASLSPTAVSAARAGSPSSFLESHENQNLYSHLLKLAAFRLQPHMSLHFFFFLSLRIDASVSCPNRRMCRTDRSGELRRDSGVTIGLVEREVKVLRLVGALERRDRSCDWSQMERKKDHTAAQTDQVVTDHI